MSSARAAIRFGANDTGLASRTATARANATVHYLTHHSVTGGPMTGACSGTLITPRLVLTSAHCVDDEAHEPFQVNFGPVRSEPAEDTVSVGTTAAL